MWLARASLKFPRTAIRTAYHFTKNLVYLEIKSGWLSEEKTLLLFWFAETALTKPNRPGDLNTAIYWSQVIEVRSSSMVRMWWRTAKKSFFCCCNKISWSRLLKEEKVYIFVVLMGPVHPCWKAWGKAAGKDRGKELKDYICICKCEVEGKR